LINVGTAGTIILNIFFILAIHWVTVTWALRRPLGFWEQEHNWSKPRQFEQTEHFYEKRLHIMRWKDRLPDGGAWMTRGFQKAHLRSSNKAYLYRFLLETKRGELTHWLGLFASPLFILWNSWQGILIIFLYSILAHLPCILVQRYNRIRLERIMSRFPG
jgi:glycosyl-4,4'-diaponeurosporenoate acyltransferase